MEEVDGILHLYGLGSLDTLYAPPVTWQPVHIAFHYIEYDEIASLLGKLASRYPQLKVIVVISFLVWWEIYDLTIYMQAIIFDSCNLSHLDQLNKMTLLPSLDTLVVGLDGNPITSLSLWQHYAVVKLNLTSLNNNTVRNGILSY